MRITKEECQQIIELMLTLGIVENNNITEEQVSLFVEELFKHGLIRNDET